MIKDDETKIHLASLILEISTLVWWEEKAQENMKKHGKVLTSWNDFFRCLKEKLLPISIHEKGYNGVEKN